MYIHIHYIGLVEASEAIGRDTLALLDVLKREKPGSGSIASAANTLQTTIRALERKATVRKDCMSLWQHKNENPASLSHSLYRSWSQKK